VHIAQFIAQLREVDGVEGLRLVMSRVTTDLGLGGFIYVNCCVHRLRMRVSDQLVVASRAAEWPARGLEPDPAWLEAIVRRAAADELPFYWGAPGAAQLAADRASGHGWTVPFHDAIGRVAALSFTSARTLRGFCDAVEAHRATLHVMAIYFHAHVRKALVIQSHAAAANLTPRELQCLGWAARGKSRTDIGQIIGVSPRTIKFHLENAQRKLNVAHTTQAVLRAVLLGLITVTDEL
jgi:DNA-binding CsgD family transcriptional regulator